MVTPLFSLISEIVYGLGLGVQLGFPTINLEYPEGRNIEDGVYVCKVELEDQSETSQIQTYFGVMHLGARETVDNQRTCEVHLLDFDGRDLYGKVCTVMALEKLRNVKKFDSIESLKAGILRDIEMAREFLRVEGV